MNNFNKIIKLLKEKNRTISTMESCTGGFIASEITNIDGSGDVFKFGAVTYSNDYKIKMGVSKKIIDRYTVYSEETSKEMSKKIVEFTNSDYGVGITGQLNCCDPYNSTNENKTIYISIYDKLNDKYYTKKLTALNSTRRNNKKMIMQNIIEILNNII